MTGKELIENSNLEFDINKPYDIDLIAELNELSENVKSRKKTYMMVYHVIMSFLAPVFVVTIAKLSGFELVGNQVFLIVSIILMIAIYSLTVNKLVIMISNRALRKGSGGKLTNAIDFSFVPTKESYFFYQEANRCKNKPAVNKYLESIYGRGLTGIEKENLQKELERSVIILG